MVRYLPHLALGLILSTAPSPAADEKREKARAAVSAFEQKLVPKPAERDSKLDRETEALVRAFFGGLKDRESKIEAIGVLDSRYIYPIPKELVEELLGKLIGDSDSAVRSRAAHAIGYNVLGHRFADELLELLKEDDPAIQGDVLYGMRGATEKFRPAMAKMLSAKDRQVRMAAAFHLSEFPPEKTAPAFRKMLGDKDDEMRAVGLSYLRLPDDELVKYLDDGSERVRLVAIDAFGRHPGQETSKRLAKLLGDPSPDIRYHAVRMLGTLKAKDQVRAVLPLLDDGDVLVRRHAVMVLEHIGSVGQAGKLQRMLKDQDAQIREHAVRVLVILDREAVDSVVALCSDESLNVRREAVQAVAGLGAKKHAGALAKCTEDMDAGIRITAARGLGRSGDKSFQPLLDALAKGDPSESVRDIARGALAELLDKK